MSRLEAKDVAWWETLVRAIAPAILFVAAGALAGGSLRLFMWIVGGLAFLAGAVILPPRSLSFEDGVLWTRGLGSTTTLALSDVVSVRMETIRWVGSVMFLARSDGSGFSISNMSARTAEVRAAIGEDLERLGKASLVSPDARPFLGILA